METNTVLVQTAASLTGLVATKLLTRIGRDNRTGTSIALTGLTHSLSTGKDQITTRAGTHTLTKILGNRTLILIPGKMIVDSAIRAITISTSSKGHPRSIRAPLPEAASNLEARTWAGPQSVALMARISQVLIRSDSTCRTRDSKEETPLSSHLSLKKISKRRPSSSTSLTKT